MGPINCTENANVTRAMSGFVCNAGYELVPGASVNESDACAASGMETFKARSGVPHAAKCGRHSLVQFVLEAKMEMPPRAVLQYIGRLVPQSALKILLASL
jgi:hypothetical protein